MRGKLKTYVKVGDVLRFRDFSDQRPRIFFTGRVLEIEDDIALVDVPVPPGEYWSWNHARVWLGLSRSDARIITWVTDKKQRGQWATSSSPSDAS